MAEGSYKQFCPVAMAAEILVLALDAGSAARAGRRLDAVQRAAARRAANVAGPAVEAAEGPRSGRHRVALEGAGEPGVFEYRLTEAGRDLKPVIEAVGIWGQRWIETEASLQNLDPNLLMWDMRRNIDPKPMPRRRSVIQVIFADLPAARRNWWLIVRAAQGGRPVLGRSGLRCRSLPVDRSADHDRNLDGLHDDSPSQGRGQAHRHREPASSQPSWAPGCQLSRLPRSTSWSRDKRDARDSDPHASTATEPCRHSTEARICSYECTFCASCVDDVLGNVCPNCGGGLAPRARSGRRRIGEVTTSSARTQPERL